MISEAKLQAKMIAWLKKQGCWVIKTTPGSGVPTGTPDVLFFYKDHWGAIEMKYDENSPFQPLQKATLKKLGEMGGFTAVAHNNNFDEILLKILDFFSKI